MTISPVATRMGAHEQASFLGVRRLDQEENHEKDSTIRGWFAMNTIDAAKDLLGRGWAVVPVPRGTKRPIIQGWPELRVEEAGLARYFKPGDGIGILTGAPSGGLLDIDLDCPEALRLAAAFLPETRMRSGRASCPGSHWWYLSAEVPPYLIFKDVDADATTLLELRGDGHQTLVPPSIHPEGEAYEWYGTLDPAVVDRHDLEQRVRRLAGAVLLARRWPRKQGSRHEIANALAGMLLRGGWEEQEVAQFIGTIARQAGDEETRDRVRAAIETARKAAKGGRTTGAPSLANLLGQEVVGKVRDWLGFVGDTAFTASTAYSTLSSPPWPDPIGQAALHGLAGRLVGLIEPHTESDPTAVLIQFLVALGSCVGRGPHFRVEADEHHMRLFAAIVGATSKGRKGTSWGQARRPFAAVDADWAENRIVSGLSSGEGLIWAVRDEIVKTVNGEEKAVDDGVDDKRLLVVESELASALRVLGREGNTLSATVRNAWDTGNLRTLTKNSPAKATGAHISILGHITRDELIRYLDSTEAGNGFANRFLWICAKRSKSLPDGGRFDEVDLRPIQEELAEVVLHARLTGRLQRDPDASRLWHDVYDALSEGKPGLFGAVTSRAEAQVTRLSCIYALLDQSSVVRIEHVQAALAVWHYADASARHIFGDSLGDHVADTILAALRANPDGLTRNEIRELFGRNQSAARINAALALLFQHGLAHPRQEETAGRPAERWFARSGYAVNAINAVSPPVEDPYRVYRVNGVPASRVGASTVEDTEGAL